MFFSIVEKKKTCTKALILGSELHCASEARNKNESLSHNDSSCKRNEALKMTQTSHGRKTSQRLNAICIWQMLQKKMFHLSKQTFGMSVRQTL